MVHVIEFIILRWSTDSTAYAVNIWLPWIESDLCSITPSIVPPAFHLTVVRPLVLGKYLKESCAIELLSFLFSNLSLNLILTL